MTAPARADGASSLLLTAGATLLTALMTYPLAFNLGIARADRQRATASFPIWNVAWVARTLVVDPLHVFDANIFYPHRGTLAYSETNLGAGALAVPGLLAHAQSVRRAQRRPCCCRSSSARPAMYYLVRYLTGDRRAAAVSAIGFAFCPFVFAHTAAHPAADDRGTAVHAAGVSSAGGPAERRPRRGAWAS